MSDPAVVTEREPAPRQPWPRYASPGLEVISGADDVMLESLLMGATGWFAGFPNAFAAESACLYDLAVAGKLAEARTVYEPLAARAADAIAPPPFGMLELWAADGTPLSDEDFSLNDHDFRSTTRCSRPAARQDTGGPRAGGAEGVHPPRAEIGEGSNRSALQACICDNYLASTQYGL
ncbi:dihydrodipicolinate synthase family protein [Streptomyces sp. NPDC087787]|uniref:dihydrodipicolinate synthase family protein n=1 Tax=Streptomyces sp. NPDC087787 TaxID=3365803 RepID=UPI0037FF5435